VANYVGYKPIMMNPRLTLFVLFVVGLLGCTSPPPDQAFDKTTNSRIQSILLLDVPEPELGVVNQGSAFGAFGLVGDALGESDEQSKSGQFDASVRGQLRLGKSLTAALEADLKRRGFEVKVDHDQRPYSDAGPDTAPVNERFDYGGIETRADAILHVSFVRAGYLSTAGSRDYQPWLYVRARLLSGGGKAPLYSQFLVFGAKFPQIEAYIPAAPQYAYPNFEALLANRVAATAGLEEGARMVAAAIGQQLR
jgi:hypothetical protein